MIHILRPNISLMLYNNISKRFIFLLQKQYVKTMKAISRKLYQHLSGDHSLFKRLEEAEDKPRGDDDD